MRTPGSVPPHEERLHPHVHPRAVLSHGLGGGLHVGKVSAIRVYRGSASRFGRLGVSRPAFKAMLYIIAAVGFVSAHVRGDSCGNSLKVSIVHVEL